MVGYREVLSRFLGSALEVHHPLSFALVLPLTGYCATTKTLAMVSEVADGGSMKSDLVGRGWDWTTGLRYLIQVANGMMFLHTTFLRHFDLNLNNVLIHQGVAKISDFGLAKQRTNEVFSSLVISPRGTPGYIAPEMLAGAGFSKSDVYSFGCMLHQVASKGMHPSQPLRQPFLINDKAVWNLIEEMLSRDPGNRPTFQEAKDSLTVFLGEALQTIPQIETDKQSTSVGSSLVPPLSEPAGTVSRVQRRILIQIGNSYSGNKRLPMARKSVELLGTILATFYGFNRTTGPYVNLGAHEIRDLIKAQYPAMEGTDDLHLLHFVGHGGDHGGRFIFEGAGVGLVDIESDIVKPIPSQDGRAPVVLILDCCRSTMGYPERPFKDARRKDVLVGFASEHGKSAYGCLYTFLLAEALWQRYRSVDGTLGSEASPFDWETLLLDLKGVAVEKTETLARQSASELSDFEHRTPIEVQTPTYGYLGPWNATEGWNLIPVKKMDNDDLAEDEVDVEFTLGGLGRSAKNLEQFRQDYPLAAYVEDILLKNTGSQCDSKTSHFGATPTIFVRQRIC